MRRNYTYLILLLLIGVDLITVNLAYFVSFFLTEATGKLLGDQLFQNYLIVFNLMWLLSAAMCRLYTEEVLNKLEGVFRATTYAILLHMVLWLSYFLFTKNMGYSRQFLIFLVCLLTLGFIITRFLFTAIEIYYRRHQKFRSRVAIVGFNSTGVKLAEYFSKHKSEFDFKGFLDEKGKNFPAMSGPAAIYMKLLLKKAQEKGIHEVYAAIAPSQLKDVRSMLESADDLMIKLRLVPDLTGAMAVTRLQVRYMDELPVLAIRREPLEDGGARLKKRAFDLIFSTLAIVFLLSWVIPIIAIFIRMDSKGPIFFRQKRSGRNNEPFWCYKFRSMYVNDESDKMQASKEDKRITKVGAFLRKTSLDELPQIWNVLLGNMTLVGPRPHMLAHTEQYRKIIDGFMVRHFLKPGITGWAQVTGFRGETKDPKLMEERVLRDIWYLENWTLALDIRIIFLTIWVVIKGDEKAF